LKYKGENQISLIYFNFNGVPCGQKCPLTIFGDGGIFVAADIRHGTPPGLCKLKYMGEIRISPIYFNFNGVPCGPKCSPTGFGDMVAVLAAEFGWRTSPGLYKLK